MSPYAGESKLALGFGIFFIVLAVLIIGYLLWMMIPQLKRRLEIKRERLDPQGLQAHPEMQSRVDDLFLIRRTIRDAMNQRGYRMSSQDLISRRMGVAIGHGVRFAYDVANGTVAARASLDALDAAFIKIKAQVEQDESLTLAQVDDILSDYREVVLK